MRRSSRTKRKPRYFEVENRNGNHTGDDNEKDTRSKNGKSIKNGNNQSGIVCIISNTGPNHVRIKHTNPSPESKKEKSRKSRKSSADGNESCAKGKRKRKQLKKSGADSPVNATDGKRTKKTRIKHTSQTKPTAARPIIDGDKERKQRRDEQKRLVNDRYEHSEVKSDTLQQSDEEIGTENEYIDDESDYNDAEDNRTKGNASRQIRKKSGIRQATRANRKPQYSKYDPKFTPYQKLYPGDQFITSYGIVQVVSDDRIPSDYGTTRLEDDVRLSARRFKEKKKRMLVIRNRMMTYLTLVSILKRKRLSRLIDQIPRGETNGKGVDEEERDKKFAADIWAEYCKSITPKEVLDPTLPPSQPKWKGYGLKGRAPPTWNGAGITPPSTVKKKEWVSWDPGRDPAVPIDSYPDRIVECVLIKDNRPRFCNTVHHNNEGDTIVESSEVKALSHLSLDGPETKKKLGRPRKDNDCLSSIVENESSMKLYLRRQMLTQYYNPLTPNYICIICGESKTTQTQLKDHIEDKICKKQSEFILQERTDRFEELKEAVATGEASSFTPPKALPKKKPLKPGEKKPPKRKKGKKYPSWLIFYPDSSPIYPEVFEHVGFKRGSNNTKFMKQKWDKIGPGRKKMEKKRKRRKMLNSTVYPQVWEFLFGGVSSAERRIERFDAAQSPNLNEPKKTLSKGNVQKNSTRKKSCVNRHKLTTKLRTPVSKINDKLILTEARQRTDINLQQCESHYSPDTPMPPLPPLPLPVSREPPKEKTTQEIVPVPVIKKKRKRVSCPIANPKPAIAKNLVVDIRPLVEEIRNGRYPSMKTYVGHHPDICFLCKTDTGNVYFCAFCSNSEHLQCVQSKVNVRDLEPDDEFMCHRCIGAVLARRNRAEKRRLQKLDESLGLTDNVGSENGKGIATIVSTAMNFHDKNAKASGNEVVWSQSDFDCHKVSYGKCPIGGPGGLICCRSCSTAYSRFLVSTSREMEGQTVSKSGQEVSELMELLLDAQVRLKQSLDVMNANDVRRTLLEKDEIVTGRDNGNII